MQQPFNPFQSWLGYEIGRAPSNHYELLGIAVCERDPAVIGRAADALMSRIRRVRPGEHLPQWQQLLDHVTRVKGCLLDPAAKAAYDATLKPPVSPQPTPPVKQAPPVATPAAAKRRAAPLPPPPPSRSPNVAQKGGQPIPFSTGAPPSQRAPAEVAFPSPSAEAAQDASVAVTQPVSTPRSALRRPGRKPPWMKTVILATWLAAAVASIGFALQMFRERPGPVVQAPEVTISRPEPPPSAQSTAGASRPSAEAGSAPGAPIPAPKPIMPAPQQEAQLGPEEMPALMEMPSAMDAMEMPSAMEAPSAMETPTATQPPPAKETPPASAIDAAKQGAFAQALAAARKLMSEHDLAAARGHLDTATAAAQTEQEKAELGRVETLLGHLDEFWKGVRKRVAGLRSGQELKIRDTVILVVEASPEQVVLRAEGKNYTYGIAKLPNSVVLNLAETGLAKGPASKVLLGCYLTVDPKGDRSRARQLFEEVGREGVDVKEMLAELSIAPPAIPSGNAAAGAAAAADKTAAPEGGKVAVPADEAQLRQAAHQIHDIFRSEYAQAATPADKARLASRLLEKAAEIGDDPVGRFVMLREAKDLAVAAGEPAVAGKAVEQLGNFYDLDALAMGASALESIAVSARGSEGQRQVAANALELITQLIDRGRIEEAKKLLELAQAAAMKSKNIGLLRAAKAASEKLEATSKRTN